MIDAGMSDRRTEKASLSNTWGVPLSEALYPTILGLCLMTSLAPRVPNEVEWQDAWKISSPDMIVKTVNCILWNEVHFIDKLCASVSWVSSVAQWCCTWSKFVRRNCGANVSHYRYSKNMGPTSRKFDKWTTSQHLLTEEQNVPSMSLA